MTAKLTRRLWTKEEALAEAKKYKHKSEFRREYPGAYDVVLRLKLMPLLEDHFVRPSAESKWTYPKILAEARKSSARTEFFKKSKAAYRAAQRTGVLSKVCQHMIEHAKPAGYWTETRILSEAKKHKTRTSFIKRAPGAYRCAVQLGILEQAYSHMPRVGSKYKRAIYAFEFPDKTVYVGLTFNFERRYREHMGKSGLLKEKTRQLGHTFVKFDRWYEKDIAAIKEQEQIEEYLRQGWTVLNKAKAGGLGKDKFWTIEMIEREAAKYSSIYDFRTKAPKAYSAASRMGILKKMTKNLTARMRPHGYWNLTAIAKEAKKYTSRSSFQKESPSAHQAAKRLGIFEQVCKHMIRKSVPVGYWTKERILSISRKYPTLSDFLKNEDRAAKAARRLGVYQEALSHLQRTRTPPGFWTPEKIRVEASNFKHRADFWKNSPGAYKAAGDFGIRDEVCTHMKPKEVRRGAAVEVNGKQYSSITKAAKAFGLDGQLVAHRLRMGWQPEEAFELVSRERPTPGIAISFRGKHYRSRSALARAYHVDIKLLEQRLKFEWSLEEALGLVPRNNFKGPKAITVNGTKYRSLAQAAAVIGKKRATIAARLKFGWTLKQAFGLEPPPQRLVKGREITVEGKTFESIGQAARYYGLNPKIVDARLRSGWSIEEALDIVRRPRSLKGRIGP
ncbi:MAG: GIY-YIG nuclease family protein [Nitrospirota bacterium]|nr:GIY-YIG nuclease family protein [Nitrospirota bacterium]